MNKKLIEQYGQTWTDLKSTDDRMGKKDDFMKWFVASVIATCLVALAWFASIIILSI